MTTPTIDDLPTPPPSRADPTNFAARGDATLGALPTLITQINVVVEWIADAVATIVAALATIVGSADTQATSTTSLSITIASKTLTIEPGKSIVASMWVAITASADGTKWMAGPVTSYDSGTGQLIVNVQRIAGSGTLASWTVVGVSPMISDTTPRNLAAGSTVKDAGGVDRSIGFLGSPPISVTAAHTLSAADNGCTLEIGTGGSITVPLHATVPLPSDFVCLFRNVTSATKPITPAAGVTLRQSGTTNTGARSVKAWGEGSIKCTGTNDLVFANGDLT